MSVSDEFMSFLDDFLKKKFHESFYEDLVCFLILFCLFCNLSSEDDL